MKTILVIEDNPKNRYLIHFMLESEGYSVIEAITGEEGVTLAQSKKPDLILMDIQLPGIDGLEATRRIRQSDSNGTVPIIAITSYAMTGDKDQALQAGCTGYIEKPINLDTFLDSIKTYFDRI